MSFEAVKTFIATGQQTKMYTLRKWGKFNNGTNEFYGSLYVQNLSIDKERAVEKGQKISDALGLEFESEIDFELNEIERRKREDDLYNNFLAPEQMDHLDGLGIIDDTPEEFRHILEADPDELRGQELAIYRILSGENVFVTGGGGCGKSWIIRKVTDSSTILCAPSGIAALNIGGTTCHKVFGLPTTVVTDEDYNIGPPSVKDTLGDRNLKRIVIDEVSMLRADYLDLIDWKLKTIRKNDKPFGGIQMVVVGDFYQIPPIVSNYDKEQYYIEEGYESRFCFTSPSWNFETVELKKVFRQNDKRQVNILSSIRKKDKNHQAALNIIQRESKPHDKTNPSINLCVFNKDVDNINNYWFNQLDTKKKTFFADYTGQWTESEKPVASKLDLKVGAKVVICANHPEGMYQNGMMGTVKSINNFGIVVNKQGTDEDLIIEEHKWERYKYRKGKSGVTKYVDATYKQYPLKLGWAISIHKSQGMTLDAATINVGRGCFEHGQLYVALSRVKDLRNLSFVNHVPPNNVIVQQEVKEFYGH